MLGTTLLRTYELYYMIQELTLPSGKIFFDKINLLLSKFFVSLKRAAPITKIPGKYGCLPYYYRHFPLYFFWDSRP